MKITSIKTIVTWEEEDGIIDKSSRDALSFESAQENMGKLEREWERLERTGL